MSAIHLRVLGRAVVERGGVPVKGRAAQSHHLALLAFLATAPGRTASRDRLIGCLWPDSDAGRARHRLSVALHAIRRGLGKDAILTAGDGLTLNPDLVRTDVEDFLDAIDSGRLREAVGAYEGPFLDGFYLKDGLDFERWMESERERLAGLYRSALKRLAAEAEAGADTRGAVEWRRRISIEAPYESAAAVALMEALVASGDLAGALAHARSYVTRVEADLGIPAHPKVMEMADELARAAEARTPTTGPPGGGRTPGADHVRAAEPAPLDADPMPAAAADAPEENPRAPPPLPPASRNPPPERGALVSWAAGGIMTAAVIWAVSGSSPAVERARIWAGGDGAPSVVVLPFVDVGSDAAAASMGRRVGEDVGATLAIVPNLDVLDPPPGALEAGGLTDARRLGRSLGARSVVSGSTRLEGLRGEVTARIIDVASGNLAREVTIGKELRSTDALVEALSMAVADSFRTSLARYIPHHYTSDESAEDAFLSAVYEHRKMDEERTWVALQHYRRAWEEDPDFALAHAIAGSAYMGLSQNLGLTPEIGWERGREHVMRAIEIDPTLPEAYSVLGRLQLYWDRDFEAAQATLRRAIMLYPEHPDARTWYAFYQLYYLHDFEGAVASIRRSLELDPLNTGRSRDVEIVLYQARRYDEIAAQRAHTFSLDEEVAAAQSSYRVAQAYRETGRYEEAIEEYRREHGRVGGPPPTGLGLTYARMGRDEEARAILSEHEARAGLEGPSGGAVAQLYAALGATDLAFEALERAYETNPSAMFATSTNPGFDPLRSDPRFDDLLRRLGFPVY